MGFSIHFQILGDQFIAGSLVGNHHRFFSPGFQRLKRQSPHRLIGVTEVGTAAVTHIFPLSLLPAQIQRIPIQKVHHIKNHPVAVENILRLPPGQPVIRFHNLRFPIHTGHP